VLNLQAAIRRIAAFSCQWQWVALVVAAPLLIFVSPTRSPALLVVPGLWLVVWVAGQPPLPRTPLNLSLLGLALMLLVSLYATPDLAFSLGKIAGLVLGFGVFYAVVHYAQSSRRNLNLALALFLFVGSGFALVALLTTSWPQRIGLVTAILARLPQRLFRLPGMHADGLQHNEVAGTLLWVAPLALALAVAWWQDRMRVQSTVPLRRNLEWWLRFLALGVALLSSLVLVFTQSRGGLLGFGAALLTIILLSERRVRRVALWVAAGAIVVGGVSVAWLGPARVSELLLGSSENVAEVGSPENLLGRVEIWSRAIYAIQDFPFTGLGLNMFRRVVPVLYPLFTISPDFDVAHAHTMWLQTALDLGLPGLIAYLALWLTLVAMLVQTLRRSIDPQLRAMAIGLCGSLAGYFVYGLTDTVALGARPGVLWWILMGLVVAVWQQTRP
jgi:putative inorganic carbon (HCO3(-)) transporter